jgi:site-specific recombinase XerD
MRINELKDQFLNYFVEYKGGSVNTRRTYDFNLTEFISYLQTKNITDVGLITTEVIENYLFGLNVSIRTKALRKCSIASFFKYLHRKKYISSNPAIDLESIKIPQNRPEYLSREQFHVFLKTIEREATPYYRERDLMLIKLFLKTGLRRAEVVNLSIGDIDLSKRTLRVKRKGNREVYLYIHDELADDLRKYLATINRNLDEALFMSKKGNRLSASSVWHLVKTYSHKAGFNGDVTVHSLRHTFGSTLLSEGVPLPYIQALMDHRSPQTTSQYLHFQNSELSQAFNRVSFEERREL